jgi:hypothetical protein
VRLGGGIDDGDVSLYQRGQQRRQPEVFVRVGPHHRAHHVGVPGKDALDLAG